VILFDDRVSPDILDFARREAKKLLVGNAGHKASRQREDIDTLISLAKAGRRVVRLIAGDPAMSDRAGEEIAACRAAGVPVDVVPGVAAPVRKRISARDWHESRLARQR
jgi:uroporphyrin-III C-methyltransferase / precorrin-2 dehydrogenase / sirohydrochlorin ferrochelatase